MSLLFSYGTLQRDDVQQSTLGRRLDGQKDELLEFEQSSVKSGTTQHANVTFNGNKLSRVPGMLFEITDAELAKIDAYEIAFADERVLALLASGRRAWVYRHAVVSR